METTEGSTSNPIPESTTKQIQSQSPVESSYLSEWSIVQPCRSRRPPQSNAHMSTMHTSNSGSRFSVLRNKDTYDKTFDTTSAAFQISNIVDTPSQSRIENGNTSKTFQAKQFKSSTGTGSQKRHSKGPTRPNNNLKTAHAPVTRVDNFSSNTSMAVEGTLVTGFNASPTSESSFTFNVNPLTDPGFKPTLLQKSNEGQQSTSVEMEVLDNSGF